MKITLYKDTNGNLWYHEGLDDNYHIMTVVDEDDGEYTYTYHTAYFTDEEFAECTTIEVDA